MKEKQKRIQSGIDEIRPPFFKQPLKRSQSALETECEKDGYASYFKRNS